MRISMDPSDPGYNPDNRRWNVSFNGAETKGVITADDEAGLIIRYEMAGGQMILEEDPARPGGRRPKQVTEYGKVELRRWQETTAIMIGEVKEVNQPVTIDTPWVFFFWGGPATHARVMIAIMNLWQKGADDTIGATDIEFSIQVRPTGQGIALPYTHVARDALMGKITSPYRVPYEFALPQPEGADRWEVLVRCLSPGGDDPERVRRDMTFESVEIIRQKKQ